MGIQFYKLQDLKNGGFLPNGGRVLDIGSSNLYSADVPGLQKFAQAFSRSIPEDIAIRIAEGSAFGSGVTRNESFVGELLNQLGVDYLAFDIANGYQTRIFDLNNERLPGELRGTFDLVLNFGTTEHVINQLNSLEVIHDATKVGGHIVHELPTVGYVDHGYFCYTPRLFFELASANGYELVRFDCQGSGTGGRKLSGIVNDFRSYFPSLAASRTPDVALPEISSFVIFKKVTDRPFQVSVETSTSVFTTNAHVGSRLEIPEHAIRSMPFSMLTKYWFLRFLNGVRRRALMTQREP